MPETDTYAVRPVTGPIRGTIRPPGSKSLTNRAVLLAALADGTSRLTGLLHSDDTSVMIESLGRLGVRVRDGLTPRSLDLDGCTAGRWPVEHAELWLENSGTSLRFLTAACTLGRGRFRLDGNARMRQRPISDLVETLKALGCTVCCDDSGCPPVIVKAAGLTGGAAAIRGDTSSQFLSSLLMAAPCAGGAVDLSIDGQLVSPPYVDMTVGLMAHFGVSVQRHADGFHIDPQPYRATELAIEPDASAASYFFAAAAITAGTVTVDGLSRQSLQGDVAFVDALAKMGCAVDARPNAITVTGRPLVGIDIDMNAISDTAQTLAVVALFADGPTTIRHVAHIRRKETDRIAATSSELRRLGATVDERPDGLTIRPGRLRPATIATYDDHRMAMSFALAGLQIPGLHIADPGCTAKTYPEFFNDLERLCGSAR